MDVRLQISLFTMGDVLNEYGGNFDFDIFKNTDLTMPKLD